MWMIQLGLFDNKSVECSDAMGVVFSTFVFAGNVSRY